MKKTLLFLLICSTLDCSPQINCPPMTDADGNKYSTLVIGSQCWTAENIRATHDRFGDFVIVGNQESEYFPYRYIPNDSETLVYELGYLYNWPAALKICPNGWHLPKDDEWLQLRSYLFDNKEYQCDTYLNIAKALASQSGWEKPSDSSPCKVGNNLESNNATGFNARPAGQAFMNIDGQIETDNFGGYAIFWSSTERNMGKAGDFFIWSGAGFVFPLQEKNKSTGASVRCLRD